MNAAIPIPTPFWRPNAAPPATAKVFPLPAGHPTRPAPFTGQDLETGGRLGTLLLLNGQIRFSLQTPDYRKSRGRTAEQPRSWGASHATENHRARHAREEVAANSRSRSSLPGKRAGLAALWLVVGGMLALYLLGFYQTSHRRERIQWARQLQAQEQEIQRLKREHHALTGHLAMRSAPDRPQELMHANYVVSNSRSPQRNPGL